MEVESIGIPLVAQGAAFCEPMSDFSIMCQIVAK